MIAVGLSDPGSGKGAGQVLREPLGHQAGASAGWCTPLRPRGTGFADAFNSTQNGAHLLCEDICFVFVHCICACLCILCGSVHDHALVYVRKIKRGPCVCVRIHTWVFVHDWIYQCVHAWEFVKLFFLKKHNYPEMRLSFFFFSFSFFGSQL